MTAGRNGRYGEWDARAAMAEREGSGLAGKRGLWGCGVPEGSGEQPLGWVVRREGGCW